MKEIDSILVKLADQLLIALPGYEIATTLSSEYFKSDSVIWGIANQTLIINFPVIITERNAQPYELFEVQTFHMPTDIQTLNEAQVPRGPVSYTRIIIENP